MKIKSLLIIFSFLLEKIYTEDPPPYIPFPPVPLVADFYPENVILAGIETAIMICV